MIVRAVCTLVAVGSILFLGFLNPSDPQFQSALGVGIIAALLAVAFRPPTLRR